MMGETYENPCTVPMPEGDYSATWTVRDGWWLIGIPGGIPCPGKGTEAHNVGMDGTFAADSWKDERTPTIEDAIDQLSRSLIVEREKLGGLTLPFPMPVHAAEKLFEWERRRRNG